ncbi:50S ribosomal protein L3 [Ferroacidibacillus organovorans]|uniref:Large ribosomal subunit protein uL3 n=1 Tax=Ferroacidibacillus organovorans TaxID=1765683 RepID=A0A162SC80_9BACL|nr:50S ribosomal protein L3 [Ferroacidibacillus organovorans]KYP79697.1 50S ribosomal protein L3 [Ferroacidibacillus organovorans]OAG94801.1 50S ribosomal protein L3 [Ferroacidibacillus organovorans]OPG14887.1 50S ribosomal protein L3 [Ferroacidibacillus organovorans]
MKGILGRKLGMTQVFLEDGNVVPVTVVEAGPCVVLQVKTPNTDGYESVQLGFADKKRPTKPEAGHAAKANTVAKRYVRELRGPLSETYEVGQEVKADVFASGDIVDVIGVSKGKGTAGPIKRHNQSRGPMAHGSKYHRGVGSLGSINANRVFKGQTMAGRMGHERVTVQNLEVVRVDVARNVLLIKGALPGPKNSFVTVRSAVKKR